MRFKLFPFALLLSASPLLAQEPLPPNDVPQAAFEQARSEQLLAVQVLLDRSPHSPGIIDGLMGGNTARAISAWQRDAGLPVTGRPDADTLRSLAEAHPGEILERYTITEADVAGPFVDVPADMEDMAGLDALGYESLIEALAEKFHMSEALLRALNPGADFAAGSEIGVVATAGPELAAVARIEVDKAGGAVRAYGEDGKLVATYPATIGSSRFPSPEGEMKVTTVAAAPTYHFDPEGREWGPDEQLTIAAGPNNPVGSTWIDLSKDGYGIHGTPDPQLIGKTSSHGCVRLTNWDAAELGKKVSAGTVVLFV